LALHACSHKSTSHLSSRQTANAICQRAETSAAINLYVRIGFVGA
jgi:hypothetical protein